MHALAAAMRSGRYSLQRIHELTNIDRWFLYRMQSIIDLAMKLEEVSVCFESKTISHFFSAKYINRQSFITSRKQTTRLF